MTLVRGNHNNSDTVVGRSRGPQIRMTVLWTREIIQGYSQNRDELRLFELSAMTHKTSLHLQRHLDLLILCDLENAVTTPWCPIDLLLAARA